MESVAVFSLVQHMLVGQDTLTTCKLCNHIAKVPFDLTRMANIIPNATIVLIFTVIVNYNNYGMSYSKNIIFQATR